MSTTLFLPDFWLAGLAVAFFQLAFYTWLKSLTTSKFRIVRGDPSAFYFILFFQYFQQRIRGTLGSIAQLSRNLGMLTAYVLSALIGYKQLPYIFIIIPIVYMINFISLPNTPQYLVKKGKFEVKRNIFKLHRAKWEMTPRRLDFSESAKVFSVLQGLRRNDGT